VTLRTLLLGALVATAGLLAPTRVAAQDTSPDTIAPMAVVRELFAAMKAGDSARVRAVFHPQMAALMSSEVGKDGVARVSATPVDAFVRVFAAPRPAAIDERISRPRTLVDGSLASVWADYDLFIGTQFSHCGVDVIHVAKVGEVWKIVALSDTRRTTGCRK
jgi:hypothetical protein